MSTRFIPRRPVPDKCECKLGHCSGFRCIENRVLGWLAQDAEIEFANSPGHDPYKEFASAWFGVPYDEVTKEQRQMAKAAVLGCGYGLGGRKDVQK